MIANSHFARSSTKRALNAMQLLFVFIFAISLIGVRPAQVVEAGALVSPAANSLTAEGEETKIAVITDFGVNITDSHKANIATLIKNWTPDAVVTGGDNYHDRDPYCYSYGECLAGYNNYTAGYTDFVTSEMFFPAYGNHDSWGHTADYISYFDYLPSTPDPNHLYYDVVIGNIHFWVLNGNVTLAGSPQQTWLAANAPDESVAWNIAIVHQAPYGTGFYGDISSTQLPYQDYGIDFVISGHNHHYERLERNGVRYFIAGRAGVTEGGRTCDGTGSVATVEFCAGTQIPPLDNYGYMQIVATETEISLRFVDEGGAVKDTFTKITEGPINTPITSVAVKDIVEPVALGEPDILATIAATPSTGITSETAEVTWDPADTLFDYSTIYTASMTLTADSGYKFTTGTTATVNDATASAILNSDGTLTVRFTFEATGAKPETYELYLPLILK